MSLTMLTRCAGGTKSTLTAADLDPSRLWTSLDARGHRLWDRAVKGYESLRVVYEIRNQIDDWNKQQAANEEAAAAANADSRKLPLAGAEAATDKKADSSKLPATGDQPAGEKRPEAGQPDSGPAEQRER
jgi:hypothetical protein